MPHISVYIHFVWSTKNREPFLKTLEIREKMWRHIIENSRKKGIFIDFINGHIDHCHCLISIGAEQTISKIMQLIKGESSFWFNKQNLISENFQWQEEFFAVSVSQSQLNIVRNYIKNQETHHQKKTFQDEYDEFITKFGFEKYLESSS